MTRQDKINLLKGISKGERSIDDIEPQEIRVSYLSYDEKSDTYEDYDTKEIITGKDFREEVRLYKQNPKNLLIGMYAV